MEKAKKPYHAPSLSEYGTLGEITQGIFGSAPDVPPFNNVNCVTAIIGGTLVTCATGIVLS
jgi:hypothetical protein